MTHSVRPWIAAQAGILVKRSEVGRDGKTAYERLKGNSAKVQGLSFAKGILWKRRRAGSPLGLLYCMWEDDVYLGSEATTGDVIVSGQNGVWFPRNGPQEDREGKMGPKQLGDDRGDSVAQER